MCLYILMVLKVLLHRSCESCVIYYCNYYYYCEKNASELHTFEIVWNRKFFNRVHVKEIEINVIRRKILALHVDVFTNRLIWGFYDSNNFNRINR